MITSIKAIIHINKLKNKHMNHKNNISYLNLNIISKKNKLMNNIHINKIMTNNIKIWIKVMNNNNLRKENKLMKVKH